MSGKPTKADRMLVAKHLRLYAKVMRRHATSHRERALLGDRSDIAATIGKFATQAEAKADRFERVAGWMVGDV